MKQLSCNRYEPNWLDRHGLGILNLVLFALRPHARGEGNELLFSRPQAAAEMNALWPRPWLYLRTLVLFAVGLGPLYLSWRYEGRVESSYLLPGLSVVGSLIMPVTLLVFFWEVNKWRSLTLLDVLRYFLMGSCLSIPIAFALNFALDIAVPDEPWYYSLLLEYGQVPSLMAAAVEEFAKAVTIFTIMYRHRDQCRILHGILVGAAVGAGFAVFESAGYIAMDVDRLLETIVMRSLTAPACHVAWGGLMGGAIAIAAKGRVRLRQLFGWKLIGMFLLVCALHAVWNYLQDSAETINASVELGIATWFLLLLMIWGGLREIARARLGE